MDPNKPLENKPRDEFEPLPPEGTVPDAPPEAWLNAVRDQEKAREQTPADEIAGPAATDPDADPVASEDITEEIDVAHSPKTRKVVIAGLSLALVLALVILAVFLGNRQTDPEAILTGVEPDQEQILSEAPDLMSKAFRFRDLDLHPEVIHADLFASQLVSAEEGSRSIPVQFREFLKRYEARMAEDDNFTLRVFDDRTGEILEIYEMKEARQRFEQTGKVNWGSIDAHRRDLTNQLIRKWSARIPREHVTIKWGRKNQVVEARERDLPYLLYEMRLARMLGMSLLSTEIGTQETFNQDWMVSSVGARSRYQLMPDILQRFDLYQYTLPTVAGNRINVKSEQHPLLSMQPYFTLLKGYSNAVGHELPGISAYHAGPFNIITMYVRFLRNKGMEPNTKVTDAYMWGITEGFPVMRQGTSFGKFSREYVASIYGAFRGTEALEVDPTKTVRTERVMLKPGREVSLSQVLAALQNADVDWGPYSEEESLYERFRRLNPHMDLPEAAVGGVVPRTGDVVLSRTSGNREVHFFLPLNATTVLESTGWLDPAETWRFDENTYTDPSRTGEETQWDREYRELVADIENFGFSSANMAKLDQLWPRFQELEQQNPTPYRHMQTEIMRTHRGVWRSGLFNILSEEVANRRARFARTASTPAS